MLEQLKLLLGMESSDQSKDALLEFTIGMVEDLVKNYCRRQDIPKPLEKVVLSWCVDLYRASSFGSAQGEAPIKSINEGDTSLTYGAAYGVGENPAMGFLKNYAPQLERWRKVGW